MRGIDLRAGFREILQIIVQELGLRILAEEQAKKPIATETLHTSMLSESVQDELLYSFEIQPFDDGLLAYWAHYGIYEDTLRRFRVCSLKSYRSQTKDGKPFELKASPTERIYAYIGNGYIKIYRPNSSKMRFLYGGRMPSPYCFGMEQLPSKGDMLFITGEERKTFSRFLLGISMRFASIAKLRRFPSGSLRVYSCVFGISSSSMIRMLPGFVRLSGR